MLFVAVALWLKRWTS